MAKAFLAPPKADETLYNAFTQFASQEELSGAQVLRRALDKLYEYGNRVRVELQSPMLYRIPTSLIEEYRIGRLHIYCATYGITVSQGIREAIALYLGLDIKEQEQPIETEKTL